MSRAFRKEARRWLQVKSNTLVYAQAKKALDQMKYEISKELNIDTSPIKGDYWG